jgi:hypothetical protein
MEDSFITFIRKSILFIIFSLSFLFSIIIKHNLELDSSFYLFTTKIIIKSIVLHIQNTEAKYL